MSIIEKNEAAKKLGISPASLHAIAKANWKTCSGIHKLGEHKNDAFVYYADKLEAIRPLIKRKKRVTNDEKIAALMARVDKLEKQMEKFLKDRSIGKQETFPGLRPEARPDTKFGRH